MSAVGQATEQTERPAYVRFERKPVEDVAATTREGHYIAKDVDYAHITPPYSREVVTIKVANWFASMEQDVRNLRFPEIWMQKYKEAYKAFQNGQEQPLDGTPIRGWGVISPAQQEMLVRINIMTVEDLAGVNDDGARRIGMGAIDMKNKANAWLKQLKDKGPLTLENAQLKAKVTLLEANQETMQRQINELKARVGAPVVADAPRVTSTDEQITADDILPETVKTDAKKK